MNRTNKQKKALVELSIHLRFLHQEMGVRGRELTRRYLEYSRASIYCHAKKWVGAEDTDKRHTNPGRPRKLTECDWRSLLWNIPKLRKITGSFTVKRLSHAVWDRKQGVSPDCAKASPQRGISIFPQQQEGIADREGFATKIEIHPQSPTLTAQVILAQKGGIAPWRSQFPTLV